MTLPPRGHEAARLVEHEVALLFGRRDGTAVDGDEVRTRIRERAWLPRHDAVHGDVTLDDQAVTAAP